MTWLIGTNLINSSNVEAVVTSVESTINNQTYVTIQTKSGRECKNIQSDLESRGWEAK